MSDLFYENGKIRVTRNVFSNGAGENYVVPNIRHIRDERKGKSLLPLIIGVLMGIAASQGIYFLHSDIILGGISGLFVILYFISKDKYSIFLTTAAGEVKAFTTKDESVFRDVLSCLKRAVSSHQ